MAAQRSSSRQQYYCQWSYGTAVASNNVYMETFRAVRLLSPVYTIHPVVKPVVQPVSQPAVNGVLVIMLMENVSELFTKTQNGVTFVNVHSYKALCTIAKLQ